MSWTHVAAARLRGLVHHGRLERELDDEVRFHLEMLIEDNLKAGMTTEEARHAALRSFGAIEPMKEGYRDRRAFALVETTAQDIKGAVRTLRRNPGFTILSATVLAVAIGVNTAMFSVLNAVLFRPLPYRSPEQLTMLWTERPSQNLREGRSAYWNVEQWRSQSQTFADMAVIDPVSATFTSAAGAEQISAARISSNFFPLLGVEPVRGRSFSAAEAEQRQRLVLISHRFWLARFGGSPDALGASIDLGGQLSRIIGILPADFQLAPLAMFSADVWEPHTVSAEWEANRKARGVGSWFVVGRLRPNVAVERAQAEMSAIAHRLDEEMPVSDRNLGVSVVPLSLQLAGPRSRLALWMLTGAVFCVLLIATTNVASLSLTRSAHRAREFAIRSALGATPARIVRQLFAESLTLSVISSALGLLVAMAGIRLILAVQPGDLARLNEVALDGRVLAGSVALCLLTAILVGLAPAITTLRPALSSLSQEGGSRVSAGVATRRIRRTLVVAEFAMAIVLLVGAGLLIRSLSSVESVDPGFRPERVLSMQLASPAFRPSAERADVYDRMLVEIQSLPGVESAGMIGDFFIGGAPERILTTEGERQNHRAPAVSAGRSQYRIFQDRRSALAQGASLFGRGQARFAAGRDCQRCAGSPRVARARPDRRTLRTGRRQYQRVLVHGRRRRGQHAAPGTGERAHPSGVRAAGAESITARDASRSNIY